MSKIKLNLSVIITLIVTSFTFKSFMSSLLPSGSEVMAYADNSTVSDATHLGENKTDLTPVVTPEATNTLVADAHKRTVDQAVKIQNEMKELENWKPGDPINEVDESSGNIMVPENHKWHNWFNELEPSIKDDYAKYDPGLFTDERHLGSSDYLNREQIYDLLNSKSKALRATLNNEAATLGLNIDDLDRRINVIVNNFNENHIKDIKSLERKISNPKYKDKVLADFREKLDSEINKIRANATTYVNKVNEQDIIRAQNIAAQAENLGSHPAIIKNAKDIASFFDGLVAKNTRVLHMGQEEALNNAYQSISRMKKFNLDGNVEAAKKLIEKNKKLIENTSLPVVDSKDSNWIARNPIKAAALIGGGAFIIGGGVAINQYKEENPEFKKELEGR